MILLGVNSHGQLGLGHHEDVGMLPKELWETQLESGHDFWILSLSPVLPPVGFQLARCCW